MCIRDRFTAANVHSDAAADQELPLARQLLADDFALGLGVGHPGQLREKPLLGIDVNLSLIHI